MTREVSLHAKAGAVPASLRCNGSVSTSSVSGREAFERAIVRGNELLREGELAEAQQAFLAALKHEPDNVRALALLGLTYFRANQYGDALPVYQELCARLPNDAAHRLNLGLVRLKLGDTDAAIEALEDSRRLDPSQGRAVNYLGLAYARAGRFADAYESFLLAGQTELASEIEPNLRPEEQAEVARRLQGSPAASSAPAQAPAAPAASAPTAAPAASSPPPAASAAPAAAAMPRPVKRMASISDAPPIRATRRSIPMIAPATPSGKFVVGVASAPVPAPAAGAAAPTTASVAGGGAAAGEGARPTAGKGAVPRHLGGGAITRAVAVASPATSGRDAATRVSTGNHPPLPLSALATHALVRPDDGDHPFEVSDNGALLVRVSERMYCRMSGVYATGGALDFEAARRRSRGASTEEAFDHGGDPMSIVVGHGYLVAFPERGRFTAVYLDDDILYLREEKVFAFSPTLRWENGNIPGLRGKLPVVQFRGDGAVAFRSSRVITPIKLPAGGAMFVDTAALVGWIGRVIPRAVMPPERGPMAEVCVECTGEGVVLVESNSSPGSATPLVVTEAEAQRDASADGVDRAR